MIVLNELGENFIQVRSKTYSQYRQQKNLPDKINKF